MIPLVFYLVLGALIFTIGLFGALTRKNAIFILISLELMLQGIFLNLVAFSRYVSFLSLRGQIFALFVMVVSAAEMGMGLALTLFVSRKKETIEVDKLTELKG